MKMRKMVALLLVMLLAFSSLGLQVAGASGSTADGEWRDGLYHYNETITFQSIARYPANNLDDPQNCWLWKWFEESFNIKLEVEGINTEAWNERMKLIFATNDLPELFLNAPIGLTLQAEYGDMEGQLIPISDYFTPDVAPNLIRVYEEVPMLRTYTSTVAGNIYGFPRIQPEDLYSINQMYAPLWYDPDTLAAVGFENPPSTLNELLEVARKIKAEDPRGAGSNNVPIGGSAVTNTVGPMVLGALGVVGTVLQLVALKDGGLIDGGEVISLQTDPLMYEYLLYMNTLYSEGLIDPDMYTMDNAQTIAKFTSGYVSMMPTYDVITAPPEEWQRWRINEPMTSDLSDMKVSIQGGYGDPVQHVYITSACKNPEAAVRMMDPCYDPRYKEHYYYGPQYGVDDGYGLLEGWTVAEDGFTKVLVDVEEGKLQNRVEYVYAVSVFAASGNYADRRVDPSIVDTYTADSQVGLRSLENIIKLNPYAKRIIPAIVDLRIPTEKYTRYTDLKTVLDEYIKNQHALFITGARPLTEDEFAKYVSELNGMGLQECLDLYMPAYELTFAE